MPEIYPKMTRAKLKQGARKTSQGKGRAPLPGVKTDAKPEVWTDPAGFASARDAFVREGNKWAQLGNSADASTWKEGAASLGQSCKGCHDKYRVKKE